jgi:hypothetical protein
VLNSGSGVISLGGVLGGTTALTSLTATSSGGVSTAGITTTGNINFAGTGMVTVTGNLTSSGSLIFADDVTVSSASVWSADSLTIGEDVLGSARLTIIPKTSGSNMTLATSGGSVNYAAGAFSGFTGDLWLGALYNANTAVSGNVTFSSALTSSGNIYAIAGEGISIDGQVTSSSGNVTMVAVTGNIIGSGSGTHISGSAIQLGALGYLGTSSQNLNITGSSVQAWQGQNPMYLGYSGSINNTVGSTVLQFIPTASGSNAMSNAIYSAQAMKAYAAAAETTAVLEESDSNLNSNSELASSGSSCSSSDSAAAGAFEQALANLHCFINSQSRLECYVVGSGGAGSAMCA